MMVQKPHRLGMLVLLDVAKQLIDMGHEMMGTWEDGILLDTEYQDELHDDYNLWVERDDLAHLVIVGQALMRQNVFIADLEAFVQQTIPTAAAGIDGRMHINHIQEAVIDHLIELLPRVR